MLHQIKIRPICKRSKQTLFQTHTFWNLRRSSSSLGSNKKHAKVLLIKLSSAPPDINVLNPPLIIVTKSLREENTCNGRSKQQLIHCRRHQDHERWLGKIYELISKGLYKFSCNALKQIARNGRGTGDHMLSKNDSSLQFCLISEKRKANSG